MIEVHALPAREGDSLWVEWSHRGQRRRMLIDGGSGNRAAAPAAIAARIARSAPHQRRFDLVVCTHIDLDHIEGVLGLLSDPPEGFGFDDFWFNGSRHLRADVLGPKHGDLLGERLSAQSASWNRAFAHRAVVVDGTGPLPVIHLPGLTLTILGPDWPALDRLALAWPSVSNLRADEAAAGDVLSDRDAGVPLDNLARADYVADLSPANGSSIVFLAEDDQGHRVLFGADAPAEMLITSLRRIQRRGRIRVDLCKVPHHGSSHNVSPELVRLLDCRHWLLSTSGAKFRHPGRRAIARIIADGANPTLWFNYRSVSNEEYAHPDLVSRYPFTAVHPMAGREGISVTVDDGSVRLTADHRPS